MTGTAAVDATGLVKTFGQLRAVDGIDLEVRQGEIFGVLGPNGAGKTTALRMLATLLPIDAGQARIFGVDVAREPHRVRQLIGITGQYRATVVRGERREQRLRTIARDRSPPPAHVIKQDQGDAHLGAGSGGRGDRRGRGLLPPDRRAAQRQPPTERERQRGDHPEVGVLPGAGLAAEPERPEQEALPG
jgi:hypothetical protein